MDKVPPLFALARGWDLAGTVKDEGKARDPDATAGVKMGKARTGTHYLLDLRHLRGSPGQVESLVLDTAKADGQRVPIAMEQEPGSAGKFVISTFLRLLAGYQFHGVPSTGSKVDRAIPFAAQAEQGKVKLLRGPWNKLFLDEAELFPFGAHDDCIDSASLTFTRLSWRQIETLPDVLPLTPGYSPPGAPSRSSSPERLEQWGTTSTVMTVRWALSLVRSVIRSVSSPGGVDGPLPQLQSARRRCPSLPLSPLLWRRADAILFLRDRGANRRSAPSGGTAAVGLLAAADCAARAPSTGPAPENDAPGCPRSDDLRPRRPVERPAHVKHRARGSAGVYRAATRPELFR